MSVLAAGGPTTVNQPASSASPAPSGIQPVAIQTQLQGLTTTTPLLATSASPATQTITSHVQQVPVSVQGIQTNEPQWPCMCKKKSSSGCCVSQVLLQPQFIKAESLLLTTLKHDPCMVTTVASPTSLATTTPVQSTSLQVGNLCALWPASTYSVAYKGTHYFM